MFGQIERAELRLEMAERELARAEAYLDDGNPHNERKLRKLRSDRDHAERDLSWARRQECCNG
jgi:hypothetical protein